MIRNIFLSICLSASYYANSQSEIDDLNARRSVILSEIERMKDSLIQVENQLEILELEELKNRMDSVKLLGIINEENTKLKKYPKHNSSVALYLNKRDKIEILDYSWTNYYYHVRYQNKTGYVYSRQVKDSDNLRAFRVLKIKEGKKLQEEAERMKEAERQEYLKRQAEAVERNRIERKKLAEEYRIEREKSLEKARLELQRMEEEHIKQFGRDVYSRLKAGKYWIGMTDEMARVSLGQPNDINRSVSSWGTREQWVYGDGFYLYFKNGILESYQN